ncbi:MAG: hypothetical protein JXR11_03590 [Balneola sp.]
MKPLKLSKKLNPLGDIMNLPEAFDQLKNTKHNSSFENLGDWLENNNAKPRKMKSLYKVAASLIFTTLILIACTVPVQHEEEIGYMIKGLAPGIESKTKSNIASRFEEEGLDISQVSISQVLIEHEQTGETNGDKLTEVVMVLPKADFRVAEQKKSALANVFNFQSLEILPIEETVERTVFESALHTFDLKVKEEISEEEIAIRINRFIHENSERMHGDAKIKTDKEGNRIVEISLIDATDNVNDFEIKYEPNGDAHYQTKKSIESLHNDLSPERPASERIKNMSAEEVKALKLREIKKQEMKKKKEQED